MRLFVVNVGVNAADAARRGTRSPVFPDGTFEFVPIKEAQTFARCPEMPTCSDLRSWTGRAANLAAFVPQRVRGYRVHAEPEFETFTYGDVLSPRAANLATVAPGDELWFLARLWAHDGARWTGASDFHFIGRFAVATSILVPSGASAEDLAADARMQIRGNAHYARLACGARSAFRVLIGALAVSRRFVRALKVAPEVAALIYGGQYGPGDGTFRHRGQVLRNANGKERRFGTFGSVTRSVQAFLSSEDPGHREYLAVLAGLAAECGRATPPTR